MPSPQLSQVNTNTLTTNIFGEKFLYHINRDSFSKISANAIFDAEFKEKLFDEDSLYVIVGTDSGLLPQYIRYQGVPAGTRYLFIEIPEVLQQLQQQDLIHALNDEIICTTAEFWEEEAKELKLKDYCYLRQVYAFKAICAQQVNLPEYAELNWQITESLQSLHFQYASSLGSQTFLIRQLENIADNILPAKLLNDTYPNQTAIILAGGPSLTDILPWVKKNRSKLVIFSVSRLSKLLISIEIEPDFIVSVDPQEENIDVSKEMFQFKKTVFLHSYHIDPSLANQWPGIKLYFGNRFPWKTASNPDNIDATGTTVSNSALNAAYHFGFQRILLAGLDLCFSKEGITHAAGNDEASIGPNFNTSLSEVETYKGDQRSSDPDFYLALRSLEHQAKAINTEHKEVINLAIDAAKAEGIKYVHPDNISLDSITTAPFDIASVNTPQLKKADFEKHYASILVELGQAVHHIKLIEKLSKKALKINEEMYNATGEIENYKDKRSLDQIEKKLNKQHRKYSSLVKSFGVLNFIRIISPHSDSDDWTAEKAKELGRIYYQSYETGAQQLLALLDKTVLRIKARLEETSDTPDFALLIEQWQQDKSYNRASMWKANHPSASIPENVAQEFNTLANKFQAILEATQTAFKQNIENLSALALSKTKAILLFKHQKVIALQNLKDGLDLHYAQESEKEPYKLLIAGYIAELENNTELALQLYDGVISIEDSPLLEEALLRVASISISQDNHANTLLALKCLSQLSPIYLPHYAESCRLTGDILEAIDSYNTYIQAFPEDTLHKLKLVNLYIEIKVYDAAELMLDHLLSIDPSMEMAQQLKSRINQLKMQVE
ncbi:MAG: hypothetical protein methR_P0390 [Methyloprofundus sp.]|nr:MAG: hypothetical protein methR_P0390 [Methyloprofundus sp.]